MEEAIRRYFQSWIDRDIEAVQATFADDAVYVESYGPEYHSLGQILRWFEDWNQRGRVLEWTIRRTLRQGRTLVAEWFFRCEYDGEMGAFDGVTIADFDQNGRIVKLCEFQSKAEHCFPYGE